MQTVYLSMPNGTVLTVRVADTPEARAQGLEGVDYLPSNAGMLFVYSYPSYHYHAITMVGCRIPLDIIWMDVEGQVTKVWTNAQPNDFPKVGLSHYVLEINGGMAEMYGVAEGSQIKGLKQ